MAPSPGFTQGRDSPSLTDTVPGLFGVLLFCVGIEG